MCEHNQLVMVVLQSESGIASCSGFPRLVRAPVHINPGGGLVERVDYGLLQDMRDASRHAFLRVPRDYAGCNPDSVDALEDLAHFLVVGSNSYIPGLLQARLLDLLPSCLIHGETDPLGFELGGCFFSSVLKPIKGF